MINKYRIKEVLYDNNTTLFFAQNLHQYLFRKKWKNIGNTISGYDEIETAKKDIELHKKFHTPIRKIKTIVHETF